MKRAASAGGVRERGSAGVAMVIALVLVQLVVVGAVVGGARDLDTAVQRADAVRSEYAAVGATHMALRELYDNADEDGDGAIGSIGGGVVANGPSIGGAHAAATVAIAGSTYTVTAKGAKGVCTHMGQVAVDQSTGSVTPIAAYATNASPLVPAMKGFSGGAWGSATTLGTLSGNVCWQVLRNSAGGVANPSRAVLSLAQDASLWISIYSGGSWGSASTLTTSAGTCNTRVFAAEYEGRTGNLMVAYRKGSSTSIYYRTYTVANPAEQSASFGLAAAPTWMELVGKPSANELLLVVSAGSNLYAGVWNGTSWGNTTTLESALPITTGRPFHAAYMNKNGTAMVVWTATSGAPKYAVWDGSAWSSASSLPAIAGGVPAGWIKLAGSPKRTSNGILFACIGTNNQINVNRWDGSGWGSNLVVETTAAANTQPRVDVLYQPDGSQGLVVWHKSGQTALRYRTWSSGAWSAQQTGPDMTSDTDTIRLERGFSNNEIMMLVRREGAAGIYGYNVYSQNGTVSTGTTTITGPTGGSTGLVLPTPPTVTAGATNLNVNGGTVAPGAYGSFTYNGNITLTSGTYIFTSMTGAGAINFDTSAGPIVVDVTTGGITDTNNNTWTNTGAAPVLINVIGGDFLMKNNSTFTNITIIVYAGSATFKNNTDGSLTLYARDDIQFKNNGTVSLDGIGFGPPGAASAVLWTAGVPGAMVDLATSLVASGWADPCGLAGSPMPSSPQIDSWAAIAP